MVVIAVSTTVKQNDDDDGVYVGFIFDLCVACDIFYTISICIIIIIIIKINTRLIILLKKAHCPSTEKQNCWNDLQRCENSTDEKRNTKQSLSTHCLVAQPILYGAKSTWVEFSSNCSISIWLLNRGSRSVGEYIRQKST